jgi:hypothetical protein
VTVLQLPVVHQVTEHAQSPAGDSLLAPISRRRTRLNLHSSA